MFPKYAWMDCLLDEKECAFVIEKGKERLKRAKTANNNPSDDHRVGSVGWFLKGEDTELDLILERVIDGFGWTVNEHFYGAKIKDIEPIQFTHYQEGDYYDWHYDAYEDTEHLRAFSASLELTDPSSYEGGGLEFHTMEQGIPDRALGRLVVFPSLLLHRARKVESGERSSLVLWASM